MSTKLETILSIFQDVPDPRQDAKVLHNLQEMIFVALCSAIADCDHWVDVESFALNHLDWFRQHVPLENGIPSHDTFSRVFARLETEAFGECLQKWVESLQLTLQDQGVHIDGKVLRHSFDQATGKDALQVVTAWAGDLHLCLGQLAVEENSNESSAVPKLLKMLELTGAVVTLDALHCMKSTAKQIREKGADYVLVAKGNQPKLHNAINQTFENLSEQNFEHSRVRCHTTQEVNGGRKEYRRYCVLPAPRSIRQLGWTDIQTIGMVYRERTVEGKTSSQMIYFISSLPPKVRAIAKHVRDHWKVENQMHWSLDVTFAEDASRIRKGNGQQIAAIFRRLALSIIKRDRTEKCSLRLKRRLASWNTNHLTQFLTGPPA